MAQSLRELMASTPLSGGNAPYVEALYEQFLSDPQSVDAKWRDYFQKLRDGSTAEQVHSTVQAGIAQRATRPRLAAGTSSSLTTDAAAKQGAVSRLVQIYANRGHLVAKTGFIDYDTWWRESFGTHTPWGAEDSAPIVTAVESALEHQLSVGVIDAKPQFRRLRAGRTLVQQGQPGEELFLLFDGVLQVEVDGKPVSQVGPGAILGEMALLRDGRRTATLRAVTPCRVAVVPKDSIDRQAMEEIAKGRGVQPER